MEYINKIITTLTFHEYIIFLTNIILFIYGSKILLKLNYLKGSLEYKLKLKQLRIGNLILFLLYSLSTFLNSELFQQVIMTGTTVLGMFLFWEYEMFYIERTYAKIKKIDGKEQRIETYQSDIFQWVASIVTIIISILILSDIWKWDSLLQTGSVFASIAAFLAITHSSWLPDNIGGLITLHKRHIEAGDVIEIKINDEKILGFVGKITLTEITLYDLIDKHPIYIRNSIFRDVVVHRLSKHDSLSKEGIINYIDLNISYNVKSQDIEYYASEVFSNACLISKAIVKDKGVRVEVKENGDYAVTWRFYYYTNARNMREAKFAMNRSAKDVSETHKNISLDTPKLINYLNLN